jgi:hypothetical protein
MTSDSSGEDDAKDAKKRVTEDIAACFEPRYNFATSPSSLMNVVAKKRLSI